jgi:V/A-type H+-transporting ATPase subunit E
MSEQLPSASGVEALIRRLQSEGVAAGREEADRILGEARAQAAALLEAARGEAEALEREAREKAEAERAAGREALRIAFRDALLQLREALEAQFAGMLRRVLAQQLADTNLLSQLVLQVAAEVTAAERVAAIVAGGTTGELALAAGLAKRLLEDGVRLEIDPDAQPGIVVRLADRHAELDLTDAALAALLLRRLAPRFRELVDGIGGGEP